MKDDNWHLVAEWCGGQGFRDVSFRHPDGSSELRSGVRVPTLNGWAMAFVGHYVVKGPNDFYPCDPDTFAARWERLPS